MSDFINDIQADEFVDGKYYMGDYQPTDQDLADMAEACQLSDDETDDMLADMHDSAGHCADESLYDDADALASAGYGMDEDYGD